MALVNCVDTASRRHCGYREGSLVSHLGAFYVWSRTTGHVMFQGSCDEDIQVKRVISTHSYCVLYVLRRVQIDSDGMIRSKQHRWVYAPLFQPVL